MLINSIIEVTLENILLELHFNLNSNDGEKSFSLCITDDGESITYTDKKGRIKPSDFNYEIFFINHIPPNHNLAKLLDNKILDVKFGVGYEFNTNKKILYYFKLTTDKNDFLFFNNGDEGAYSFDKMEAILFHDIYGFEWSDVNV